MAKFILDGQEYGGGSSGSNIVKLTQAEYDALSNDKLSNDIIYLITDSGELTAENLFYDGSQTGLGNTVQDAIDACFQSVSNGKNLIASAITDKKVPTDATSTFEQMEANIRSIKGGSGNATNADVLAGKTFTNNDGVEYTGTMPNLTNRNLGRCGYETVSVVQHPDDPGQALVTIPYQENYTSRGYIDETTTFTCNVSELKASNIKAGVRVGRSGNHGANDTNSILGTFTSDATATAADITEGKTAYANGQLVVGIRPAAPNTLSGSVSGSTGKGYVHIPVKVTFNPIFDTIPKVTYTFNGQRSTCSITEITRDYVLFDVYHTHGNESHYYTITWTATIQ